MITGLRCFCWICWFAADFWTNSRCLEGDTEAVGDRITRGFFKCEGVGDLVGLRSNDGNGLSPKVVFIVSLTPNSGDLRLLKVALFGDIKGDVAVPVWYSVGSLFDICWSMLVGIPFVFVSFAIGAY